MTATELEKNIYGDDVKIISRTDDCTVYRLEDGVGYIDMTCYSVFPGIDLVYDDVHMHGRLREKAKPGNIFELNHCREGRFECEFEKGSCYLQPGDLTVCCKPDSGYGSSFPLGYYRGITIVVDVDKTPECLSYVLGDVNVDPRQLMSRFYAGGRGYISRCDPAIDHIFSELYGDVPENIRKGYFKVKILELFLFLSALDVDSCDKDSFVSKPQVELAKSVCRYLTEHMDSRVTLDALCGLFHASGTSIKNSFRAVYGESIYSYIRTLKMQSAAHMLKTTDLSVLEVAGAFGYNNGSKFAKAFRDVYNVSPNEYRQSAEKIITVSEQSRKTDAAVI